MLRTIIPQKYFSLSDLVVVFLIGTVIYGIVAISHAWGTSFHAATNINLALTSLPYYTMLSAMRGMAAFLLSLVFTLVVGYAAARSKKAEQILIPLLDILQSIPVLGFLPGLVLALIALFPHTNFGLELSSIIMIFTGQVWNMTFSYYASLKSVPSDFHEVSRVMGLSWWQKLWRVEFPYSAVNLAWNSLMSMSGGWFFLSVCEAFTLGTQEYRLPGIGAYMAVAIQEGNTKATYFGILAMAGLILAMDFFIWRPVLGWAHQFRLEDIPGAAPTEPIIQLMIKDSKIMRWIKLLYRRNIAAHRVEAPNEELPHRKILERTFPKKSRKLTYRVLLLVALVTPCLLGVWGVTRLLHVLAQVTALTWLSLVHDTGITFGRVVFCLAFSSLWTVPVGIWIGTSPKRIRRAQPIIQLLASFPAPMLYPLALAVMLKLGMSFGWAAMWLMILGVQWYILFNVLAGATRIPRELVYAISLMKASRRDRWFKLYIPSIFPSLVTGWITAAGGAWNASIVAEYMLYHGKVLSARGLGSTISLAASNEDFTLLAASLTVMVIVVIALNRTFWSKLYDLAQNRFRLEM